MFLKPLGGAANKGLGRPSSHSLQTLVRWHYQPRAAASTCLRGSPREASFRVTPQLLGGFRPDPRRLCADSFLSLRDEPIGNVRHSFV